VIATLGWCTPSQFILAEMLFQWDVIRLNTVSPIGGKQNLQFGEVVREMNLPWSALVREASVVVL